MRIKPKEDRVIECTENRYLYHWDLVCTLVRPFLHDRTFLKTYTWLREFIRSMVTVKGESFTLDNRGH